MNVTVTSKSVAEARRARLGERLRQIAAQGEGLPLSFSQQRLWFLDQLEPNSALYNVASVARVAGPLDKALLERAVNMIIQRHEALRTRFKREDGTPLQVIDQEVNIVLNVCDYSNLPEAEQERQTTALLQGEVKRPFNLATDRLVRVNLIRHKAESHVLAIIMHHIISDEWSLKLFFNELAAAYTSLVRGTPSPLRALPIQYSDFAAWQRKWLRGGILEKQLGFWKNQLKGELPSTELLPDRPRRAVPEFAGSSLSRRLSRETTDAVKAMAEAEQATLFMVLLAGFKALVARYTGHTDIIVGSPFAGRSRVETESLIGFFVNTLPLRTQLDGNPSFHEIISRVRQMTLDAYANQDLPLDKLVEAVRPERSLTHMPFTRLMFTVQTGVLEELELDGARLQFEDVESQTAKFDLTFVAQDSRQGLTLKAEYDTALFDRTTIERLLEHFETLLTRVAANPDLDLWEIPILEAREHALVTEVWTGRNVGCAPKKCINQVFEAQAERSPRATAMVFGKRRLTYGELNIRANQVAHYLRQLGVGPDVPVAICARRSIELIVGMLGVLKAGGAYVPLDTSYPRERLEFMLKDMKAPVLLSEQGLVAELPQTEAKVVCLDSDWELMARESRQNPSQRCTPESLAYIMYTSGSTGAPKGVCVPHRAVCRLVQDTNYIRIDPSDRIAQVSNVSFDAATFEIWGALLNGARLVKIDKGLVLSPPDFAREMRAQKISGLFLTTALFNQLAHDVPDALATVRTVLFGGEVADPRAVRAVLQNGKPQRLLNVYGPTENTTFSTWHLVDSLPEDLSAIPIGIPIANTEAYVLDAQKKLAPVGVPGELYLGGCGLAQGYWNRPEITTRCFENVDLGDGSKRRLYRTGDLARWLPDGELEFLGRLDNQVKIRGFRVEPGEIETVLTRHPLIRECAVTVDGSSSAERRLVAYVVVSAGSQVNASELRSYLKGTLPDYMVPSTFVTLEAMPLTPNGKVDRRSLPPPDQARPRLEPRYIPARDDVEQRLIAIWEAVLSVRPIGVDDKFFDLGGHSLLAVRLVSQIEKAFGRKLRLATVFQAPTIGQLAAVLREDVRESSFTSRTSLVEIQAQGSRPPLFLVHGAGGGMFWGYVNLSRHLGKNQPAYGFRSRGLDGLEEFETIEELASHYVEDMRRFQPKGPYYLGGYCFGGNVAFEMARQLRAGGEEVALLALINAAPANSRYLRIPWTPVWWARFAKNLVYWGKYFLSWSGPQRREFFAWKWSVLKRRLKRGQSVAGAIEAANLVDLSSYSPDQRKVWETHIRALANYHPQAYSGEVQLLRSGGHPLWCSFEPDYGWGEFVRGGVRIITVPGAHEKVLEEPCVEELAKRLQVFLPKAPTEEPASRISAEVISTVSPGNNGSSGVQSESCAGEKAAHLVALAPSAASESGKKEAFVRAASHLPDLDRERLWEWNETGTPFDLSRSYIAHFEEQVRRTPEAPAVRQREQALTYAELNRRANQLAGRLQTVGVGPGTLAGVCLDRSIDLVVCLLAIWKCGAAYLPLDPHYPRERLSYMLEDSGARVLILHKAFADEFDLSALTSVVIDSPDEQARIATFDGQRPTGEFNAESLAYVIYTSGSTGKPKGVEIWHRSLLNHNFGIISIYKLSPEDRSAQFSPISFDISVEEIFPTLLSGGLLILRTEDVISSVATFLRFVAEERITVLNLPTAYWHEMVEHLRESPLPECVRLTVIGGEKASDETFRLWKQRVANRSVTLINTYGPTETTVTATYFIPGAQDECLAIGKPLPNVQLVVLDKERQLAPVGETGELFIGGEGLALGYLKRPELTQERFIANDFGHVKSDRLYRTGDLVRFRPDGNLDFVGRVDQQVKIRGFRIELGEIESTLQSHPEIKDAAVLAREDKPGQKKLVAYIVPRSGQTPHVTEMLQFLRQRLPAYMVPASLVVLPAFPMTPAGKVDRRALPAPGAKRPDLDQEYVPPRTPTEGQLAAIFAEVLEVDRVGVLDSFFDLGGHSLIATQVLARVREAFSMELDLGTIFGFPCVTALAEEIERLAGAKLLFGTHKLPGTRTVELTAAQKRIWFLDQFEPAQSPYNLSIGLRLSGPLDVDALGRSLTRLVERHEVLRSVFPAEEGTPVQHILPLAPAALKTIDLLHLPESQREQEGMRICVSESARPYITYKPLFCPTLIRLGPTNHILLILLHEIAVDHQSAQTLLRELAVFYEAETTGSPLELTAAPAGRVAPQVSEEPEDHQRVAALETFWEEKLRGAPELLDLPADRPRPAHATDAGATISFNLPREISGRLNRLNVESEGLAEKNLLAAFHVLLSRYTGCSDIITGTPVSMRPSQSAEDAIGPFEDRLVLRQDLSGDPTFREALEGATQTLEEAREHGGLSFDRIIELANPTRNSSYTSVFQVLFRFEARPPFRACPGGVSFVHFPVDNRTSKYDLTLRAYQEGSDFKVSLVYSRSLFDDDRIQRLARHYKTLLAAALENPDQRISRLPLMDDVENEEVLVNWNRTERPFASHKTLIQLFEEQARRTPGREALISGDRRLTYGRLAQDSARVAAKLRALGVGTEGKVALCMERSWEMVPAILGTLRAGATYLPVDPAYPKDRIAFLLQDAEVSVLLTQRRLADSLPAGNATVLCIEDIDWDSPAPEVSVAPSRPEDVAYIIYTSGSTGKPKGVLIEQRNAVAFMHWAKDTFDAEELSGVLAATSVCFDLSIFELFAPLCWGGRVILAKDPLALPSLAAAGEVRLVNTVPSAMRELVRIKGVPPSVRTVNLAGEPLPTSLVDEIYGTTRVQRVLDLYGPTETTTYSTWTLRLPGVSATIGRPLANEQIYLLDANREPVPIGIPGEVYIGGAGVARGYLNRPQLTVERFIENPFKMGSRLYRTGDIARWRADGNLEYLGRIDQQVKIRGFRVELGEIETALRSHPRVTGAIVMAREDKAGEKFLAAYLTTDGSAIANGELQGHLESRLPHFMVPSFFKVMEAFPLTPNGKVDRKALPPPEVEREEELGFVPPRNDLERELIAIWQSVLPIETISVRDSFFDLGGHSLLAIRLTTRVRESLKVKLPLFSIFENPTIEGLAAEIATGKWNAIETGVTALQPVPREMPLPASFVQERLWFLDQLNPGSDAYNVPAALRLKGKLDVDRLKAALGQVVARHEALRTTFELSELLLVQRIAPELRVNIPLTEVPGASAEREARLRELLDAAARRPFDLTAGPLVRAELFRLEQEDHVLLITLHHTISDGWSLAILFKDLESFYGSPSGETELAPLPIQYADYAFWQRGAMAKEALEKELDYWKARLRGAPEMIRFPGKPVTEVSQTAERLWLDFPPDLVNAMNRCAQMNGTTPFGLLMGALAITLSKWTGQEDLVIGTVVAGRSRRELESLIGCFMNFLPIRLRVSPELSSEAYLREVRNVLLEAQAHQDCPFEKIVGAINPERKGDSNPLYNVALLWQNFPHDLFQGEGLESATVPVAPSSALLDLRFEAEQQGSSLSLVCEYRSGKFEPLAVGRMLETLRSVLESLIGTAGKAIKDIEVSPDWSVPASAEAPKTRKQIALSGTFTTEPLGDSLNYWMQELGLDFEPVFAPYNQVFQELLNPSSLLAGNREGLNVTLIRLEDWIKTRANGGAGSAGKMEIERNVSELVANLKTFSASNSAPHLVCICPPSRQMLLDSSWADFLFQQEEYLCRHLEALPGVHVLRPAEVMNWYPVEDCHDEASDALGHVPYTPLFYTALGTAIARKLHRLQRAPTKVIVLDCDNTLWSGVCGEDGAQGVRLERPWKALQEFMRAQQETGMLLAICSKNNPEDVEQVFAQRTDFPLTRDHFAAVRLNWAPKSENLRSIARELNLGLDSFIFIDDNPVECAEVEANCPEVLTLLLPDTPDEFSRFLAHAWVFDRARSTAEDRKRAESYRQNQQRERLRSKSSGLGEFIAGLGLKVEAEPLCEATVGRVSQLTQRTNQFNLTTRRRTEAEIKNLKDAEVLTWRVSDRFGDYGLVGVLIFRQKGEALDVDTFLLSCRVLGRGVEHRLLAHLGEIARARHLNWVDLHYLPTAKNKPALNFLENAAGSFKQHAGNELLFRLPTGLASGITFNVETQSEPVMDQAESPSDRLEPVLPAKFRAWRKVATELNNVQAIHERIEANLSQRPVRAHGPAPKTEMERQLAELWSRLLRRPDIGVTDSFFDLGGHSLLAVRLFAEIERMTGRKFPLVTLFQAPTIRELARTLQRDEQKPAVQSLLVPIQPLGSLPPLFLVHGAGGDVLWGYANLAAHLPTDRPVYGIKSRGQVGLEECTTIREMATCYVEAVRKLQPHGPYLMGGYCFGGNVAYEMARTLQAQGEEVQLVVLLDSSPANAGYEEVTWWSPRFVYRFTRNALYWLHDFSQMKFEEQRRFVVRKTRVFVRMALDRIRNGKPPEKFDLEQIIDLGHFPDHELKLWQTHIQALVDHVDQPYQGKVVLFRTRGQPILCSFEEDFCWGRLVGGPVSATEADQSGNKNVEVVRVPGSHENIFMEPNVRVLARELAKCLPAGDKTPDNNNARRGTTELIPVKVKEKA